MSDLRFACPFCGQHICAEASAVRAPVNCPSCGAAFRVELPSGVPPPAGAPRHRHRWRASGVIRGLILAAGLLAVLSAGMWLMLQQARHRPFREAEDREKMRRGVTDAGSPQDAALQRIRRLRLKMDAEFKAGTLAEPYTLEGPEGELFKAAVDGVIAEMIATHGDDVPGNGITDIEGYFSSRLPVRLAAIPGMTAWLNAKDRALRMSRGAERGGGFTAAGTGYWISPDGWLLTSRHVVEGASAVIVRTGGRTVEAHMVSTGLQEDIALLRTVERAPHWLRVSGDGEAGLGAPVFTVGFPNPSVQGMAPKFSAGAISSLSGVRDDPGFFQTSVPVLPGNSGGALVDRNSGHVLGMITARLNGDAAGIRTDNVSYALKSGVILRFLQPVYETSPVPGSGLSRGSLSEQEIISLAEKASVLVLVKRN